MYVLNIDIGYCKGYIKTKIYFPCSGMYTRYWSKLDKKKTIYDTLSTLKTKYIYN